MANDNKSGSDAVNVRRNKDLFNYLITTFTSLLPPEESEKFARLADEVTRAVSSNCGACQTACQNACLAASQASLEQLSRIGAVRNTPAAKDPRRQRFLLRLVAGRISHLFVGDRAILPRTVVEGMDRYLRKALGDVIYSELNRESELLLEKVGSDDDRIVWERISETPDWRRFADTILIRILLKFENFQAAKRIFMSVVGMAMNEGGKFQIKDGHFHILFEALFGDMAGRADQESQRILWDYQFGDETGKRLVVIFNRAKGDRTPPKAPVRK